MNTVTVRGLTLGAGLPKLIVPLVCSSAAALPEAAAQLAGCGADLIEWRLDALADTAAEALPALLPEVRAALGETPLLATFRTAAEGGARALTPDAYLALGEALCRAGGTDLLDVELSAGEAAVRRLRDAAHACGAAVVVSSHDFAGTPPQTEMVARMRRMQAAGADIAKLAVMPHSRADVLALLAATAEMTEKYDSTPVITMSMGRLGAISRLCCEAFGSAAVFASAGISSAPGQMPLDAVRQALGALHACLSPSDFG